MNPKQQAGGAFYEKHVCEEDRRHDRGCSCGTGRRGCGRCAGAAGGQCGGSTDLRDDGLHALDTVGGGEIVSQEVSSEGLWNEYSYEIINGDTWYDIEISGFGSVTELESVSSQYPRG